MLEPNLTISTVWLNFIPLLLATAIALFKMRVNFYHIDNNGTDNAIRPLAIERKNYLFCGNHDAAVRAAIIYSLFASCKAHDIDIRNWLEDTLKRIPTEKDITMLLPENWQPVTAK